MGLIYVVVDKYGFISAYDAKESAVNLVNEWSKTVDLMVMTFPLDEECQKDEVYFIPYSGLETDVRFPVASVSNNKKYSLSVQNKLVQMECTFPDDLSFFTKKFNCIDPIEHSRLTNSKLRVKEALFDSLITKIEHVDDPDLLKKPFEEMISGLLWSPEDLLQDVVKMESDENDQK